MSFAVFTDSCSNLPGSLLQHFGIRVLPCSYTVDGKQIIYGGDIEAFDAHTYYELLRQGKRVTTSLLNTQVFLDHFRPALEQGLDTPIGERGAGLTEGQLQRIAIARAIFADRPVLLLDEATSALDEATEARLLSNLRQMTDKTVLIVTHRPAALSIADRTVALVPPQDA